MKIGDIMLTMQDSAASLTDYWLVKFVLSLAIAGFGNIHGMALCAFTLLVFIDLISKWVAISYGYLKELGEEPDLLSSFLGIKRAHQAGKISSRVMGHRFVSKFIWYAIVTIVAASADYMAAEAGYKNMLLPTVWLYLTITEVMSILENFHDAGVNQASDLLDLIRNLNPLKKGGLK